MYSSLAGRRLQKAENISGSRPSVRSSAYVSRGARRAKANIGDMCEIEVICMEAENLAERSSENRLGADAPEFRRAAKVREWIVGERWG